MEPFRSREMDSSQRSMDNSQGSSSHQRSPLQGSPSRTPGAALAHPPSFGNMGGGAVPASAPALQANGMGYGYPGQPLAAPPAQQAQNQRLLHLQRQQQLRQLHQQQQQQQQLRQTPTNQQSQNLSQLQQNFMQQLNSDNRPGAQRNALNTGQAPIPSPGSTPQSNSSNLKPQGLPPPPPTLTMNRAGSSSSMSANYLQTSSSSPGNSILVGTASQASQLARSNAPIAANAQATAIPPPSSRSGIASLPTTTLSTVRSNNTTHPNMPPPSSHAANGSTSSIVQPPAPAAAGSTSATPLPPPQLPVVPETEIPGLLAKCDWKDRTLWVSRQLLGGQALNGFLRSTATVQRIKRQRARQVKPKDGATTTAAAAITKQDDTASINSIPSATSIATGKKRDLPPEYAAEEDTKVQVMNARTAKKIKSEMEVALKFCETMHETLRSILKELNVPDVTIPSPLGPELPVVPVDRIPSLASMKVRGSSGGRPLPMMKQTPRSSSTATASTGSKAPAPASGAVSAAPAPLPVPPVVQAQAQPPSLPSPSVTAAGSAKNSTLRRNRRKKIPPSNSLNVGLAEVDATGKRLLSKKDFSQRTFEVVRFRALQQGDHVAARLSSRDLWILARVTKEYPSVSVPSVEFLQLSTAKRDSLFREKVLLRDVEDKESGATLVARSLVLPLPRDYSEAAEWGQHYRKGSRVYAMYPETTSLYTATVVDNTTYCQGDDDIIVVEFDGDEPDHTGSPPKCHIPARFVALIPREFPSAQDKATRRQSAASGAKTAAPGDGFSGFEDPLNSLDLSLDAMQSFDAFDDLEFDLGFDH